MFREPREATPFVFLPFFYSCIDLIYELLGTWRRQVERLLVRPKRLFRSTERVTSVVSPLKQLTRPLLFKEVYARRTPHRRKLTSRI